MSSWNYTINDTDPIVTYAPYPDGSLTAGWAPWFSSSGFLTSPGENSVGNSLHITAFSGASLEVQFHGSAVYVYGSANCSYDVTLDSGSAGTNLSSSTSVLFSKTGLPVGTHFLNLTARPTEGQQFSLDHLEMTDVLPDGVTSLIPVTYDNQNSTLQYQGSWKVTNDSDIPATGASKPYHETTQSMASVSLNFTNAVAIAIDSPLNWGHWIYNVVLDGVTQSYNASTYWKVGNARLFYQSGLDSTENYSVELINASGDGMFMDLNDITLFAPNITASSSSSATSSSLSSSSTSTSASSSSSSPSNTAIAATSNSKHNVGKIVGPIVAVVVILAAAALGVFLWRRKRLRAQMVEDMNTRSTPYYERSAPTLSAPLVGGISGEKASASQLNMASVPVQPFHGSAPSSSVSSEPHSIRTPKTASPPVSQVAQSPVSNRAPQSAASQSTTAPSQGQTVDVDRIIELIAQRIDRAPPTSDDSPPRYPA